MGELNTESIQVAERGRKTSKDLLMKSDGRQAKRLQRAQRAPAHSSFSVGFRFRLKLLGRFSSSVQYAAMLPNDGADAETKSPSLGPIALLKPLLDF